MFNLRKNKLYALFAGFIIVVAGVLCFANLSTAAAETEKNIYTYLEENGANYLSISVQEKTLTVDIQSTGLGRCTLDDVKEPIMPQSVTGNVQKKKTKSGIRYYPYINAKADGKSNPEYLGCSFAAKKEALRKLNEEIIYAAYAHSSMASIASNVALFTPNST